MVCEPVDVPYTWMRIPLTVVQSAVPDSKAKSSRVRVTTKHSPLGTTDRNGGSCTRKNWVNVPDVETRMYPSLTSEKSSKRSRIENADLDQSCALKVSCACALLAAGEVSLREPAPVSKIVVSWVT